MHTGALALLAFPKHKKCKESVKSGWQSNSTVAGKRKQCRHNGNTAFISICEPTWYCMILRSEKGHWKYCYIPKSKCNLWSENERRGSKASRVMANKHEFLDLSPNQLWKSSTDCMSKWRQDAIAFLPQCTQSLWRAQWISGHRHWRPWKLIRSRREKWSICLEYFLRREMVRSFMPIVSPATKQVVVSHQKTWY